MRVTKIGAELLFSWCAAWQLASNRQLLVTDSTLGSRVVPDAPPQKSYGFLALQFSTSAWFQLNCGFSPLM